jgi:phospholipase C
MAFIIKEKRTFDYYMGRFPGAKGDSTLAHESDPPTSDLPHDQAAWLHRATGAVRQQYYESDIPGYLAFARHVTVCHNHFTGIASQSQPNHRQFKCVPNTRKQKTSKPKRKTSK